MQDAGRIAVGLCSLTIMGGKSLSGRALGGQDYPIAPVPFTAVRIDDGFWKPRLEINRTVTVPYCFKRCEDTGRLDNFAKAGKLMSGPFVGIYYNDSDVYKVIEGAAYTLALAPDPKLDKYLDDLIAKIAAAQEADGYLYTARTIDPNNPPKTSGPERWSNLAHSHELYNVGHLYEAAVAHHLATGKRNLLDVALKNADLIAREFGPDGRRYPPGHQEIEIGLVKLFRLTGEARYLDLARFFLDQRGRADGHKLYGEYSQDHVPVVEQDRPVGHAVRAGYMYCGMADVAAIGGEAGFAAAIDRLWQNMVGKRLYITGGIGARAATEAFGDDYELPNEAAYAETCAAIASGLWNERMFLRHGEAQYIDLLERVLYNGFLAGVSLDGDKFFYVNPLATHGGHVRQPWYDCACCPTNVVRFLPSIPGYVYAVRDRRVYVNLFFGGSGQIKLGDQAITLRQQTRYPWDGAVSIAVEPERPAEFEIAVRIPGWARGQPVPSDLYQYADSSDEKPTLRLNGEAVRIELQQGYAVLARKWQAGDRLELNLPMPVRRVVANPKVEDDRGRVALERGPLVYCLEGCDHDKHVHNLVLPDDAELKAEPRAELLGGVTVLRGEGRALRRGADGSSVESRPAELTAVPYYAWCHREPGEMEVWIARMPEAARPLPLPTPATSARVSSSLVHDAISAVNDQLEPKDSNDHGIPRLTWWDHRGTAEWVRYEFAAATRISGVEVYWFDDERGRGGCRVPASCRLMYLAGEEWRAVAGGEVGVKADQFNGVEFEPVETTGLRLEVQLQPGFSGGILEWRVK